MRDRAERGPGGLLLAIDCVMAMCALATLLALTLCHRSQQAHGVAGSRWVTINNTRPRLDNRGGIMNTHDGTVRWLEGMWWMHAAEYGECADPAKHGSDPAKHGNGCGFGPLHNVSIYRSPDLRSGSWEFVGHAVQCAELKDCGILYRPHLTWNPSTKLYVLMYNYVYSAASGKTGYAGNAVATAPHPAGPFTMRTHLLNTTYHTGDFDVYVDPANGEGWIIYSMLYKLWMEKLTPDFLATTGESATMIGGSEGPPGLNSNTLTAFAADFIEAPAIFKRNDVYYAAFGYCCAFCYQGSGLFIFTAPRASGPWRPQTAHGNVHNGSAAADLGCLDGGATPRPRELGTLPLTAEPTPGQGCLYKGRQARSVTQAQQNFIIEVETSDAGAAYIWTGDRWMQSPDGTKAHEPQFWTLLEFDADGKVLPLKWRETVSINMSLPQPPSPTNTVWFA